MTVTIGTGWGSAPTYTAPDPLIAGVEIKLEHLTELRAAVNQLRTHAGLSAAPFTVDPNPERNVTFVKADHILQLRTALEGARSRLGLSTGDYAHPGLAVGDGIYAIDFQELRNQIAAARSAVTIQWLVTDHLGTPRMIFDQSGSLANVSRHDYLPFGEELFSGAGGRTTTLGYSGNDATRQKFTQKDRDNETGLDYFLARYYSSTQGRFTSPDPIFISEKQMANPQSWNLYGYVNNNPLSYLDPTGMERVRLGQNSDEKIDRQRKEKEDRIKQGKKDGTLTKAEEKKLKAERNTLGLEKEGNALARAFITKLNSKGEGQGLQVSDFTLSTNVISDFVTDPKFVMGFSQAQDAFHLAIQNTTAFMFTVLGGYSNEIFINTNSDDYKGTPGQNSDGTAADYILYAGTSAVHERTHRDRVDKSEHAAYTEQLRVLQKFGPRAFSPGPFYDNAVKFVKDGSKRPD